MERKGGAVSLEELLDIQVAKVLDQRQTADALTNPDDLELLIQRETFMESELEKLELLHEGSIPVDVYKDLVRETNEKVPGSIVALQKWALLYAKIVTNSRIIN